MKHNVLVEVESDEQLPLGSELTVSICDVSYVDVAHVVVAERKVDSEERTVQLVVEEPEPNQRLVVRASIGDSFITTQSYPVRLDGVPVAVKLHKI